MTARIYEAQGRHDEAIVSAEQAVESAKTDAQKALERGKPEEPSILRSYEAYLSLLKRPNKAGAEAPKETRQAA